MATDPERQKLAQLASLLDEIDLGKLTLDDLRNVQHPVLAQGLRDFLSTRGPGPVAELHHNSHFVHISHGSSLAARPGELNAPG